MGAAEVVFVPNPKDGAAVPVAVDPNAGAINIFNTSNFLSGLSEFRIKLWPWKFFYHGLSFAGPRSSNW